jgi:hypothetical protein
LKELHDCQHCLNYNINTLSNNTKSKQTFNDNKKVKNKTKPNLKKDKKVLPFVDQNNNNNNIVLCKKNDCDTNRDSLNNSLNILNFSNQCDVS